MSRTGREHGAIGLPSFALLAETSLARSAELSEVIDAATKLFAQIDLDDGHTLEHKETEARLTDADWRAFNKDNDNAIEMNEWLAAVRQRFNEADASKLAVQELDSPAGQLLIKLIIK